MAHQGHARVFRTLDENVLFIVLTTDYPIKVTPFNDSKKKKDAAASEKKRVQIGLLRYAPLNVKRTMFIRIRPNNEQSLSECKAEYAKAVENFTSFLTEQAPLEDWSAMMALSRERLNRARDIWVSIVIDSLYELYCSSGMTRLIIAIELNEDGKLDRWIEEYLSFCSSNSYDSQIDICAGSTTALISAVKRCQNQIMRLLVSRGAQVNAVNEEGASALAFAALTNNIDAIIFLLEKGALIDSQLNNGYTPLHIAISQDKNEAAVALIQGKPNLELRENQTNMTPLLMALARKNPYLVQQLLNNNADPNVLLNSEESALMLAVSNLGLEKNGGCLRDADEVKKACRVLSLLLQDNRLNVAWANEAGSNAYSLAQLYDLERDDIAGKEKLFEKK
jgi:ankyrin repeat protein